MNRVPLGPPRPATGDANTTTSPSAWADNSWVLKTAAALGVVIGLILLLRFGWSRLTGQAPAARSPVVEVLSRTTIAPRNHVLLLRLGDRILVVADSAAGLRTLANVDDPEEVASLLTAVTAARPNSISRGFAHVLNRFNRDYTEDDRLADEAADIDEYRTDRARDQLSSLLSQVRTIGTAGGREVSR